MRAKEFVYEDIENPRIDWNKFRLGMTALAAAKGLEKYQKIDGIVFLGLVGDPNSQSILDVRLKSPAKVGVTRDAQTVADLGFEEPNSPYKTAGEYYRFAYTSKTAPSPEVAKRGYELRKQYQYNIIINHRLFDRASNEIDTDTLAHEARHRGFDIISQIPEIRKNIPKRTERFVDLLGYSAHDVEELGLDPNDRRDSLEHLLIYSVHLGEGESIGPGDKIYRSKQEVLRFRQMYQDIEQAATAYVRRYPVPSGGYEALRKEVDRITPDNVNIQVRPDADGKPIVIGFIDKIVQGLGQLIPNQADLNKMWSDYDKRKRR
jgi:hypothetical protein